MKYVIAFFACVALHIIYAFLGVVLFGWTHGGGAIPMTFLFMADIVVFIAITRSMTKKDPPQKMNPQPEPKPKPFVGFQDIPKRQEEKSSVPKSLPDGRN